MISRPFTIATVVLSLAVFGQTAWSATTLDHSGIIAGSTGLGSSDFTVAAYGQTFTAGSDNILTDFTFYDGIGPAGATLQLTVAQWTGSTPGSVMFTSNAVPTVVYPDYHPQAFTFATGDLHLVTGHQYVAYLQNTSGLGGTTTYLSYVGALSQIGRPTGEYYGGGSYVNLSNTDSMWRVYNGSGQELQSSFKADFITSVPEPSGVAIFAIAFTFLLFRFVQFRKKGSSLNS